MAEILPLGQRLPYGYDNDGYPIIEDNRIADSYERWLVGTYAIWALLSKGNLRFVSGHPKSECIQRDFVETLRCDWDIETKDQLVSNVTEQVFYGVKADNSYSAWHLTRANSLAAMGYLSGMITRLEMRKLSVMPSQEIQSTFSSWEQVGSSYLAGYEKWAQSVSMKVDRNAGRHKYFNQLKSMKNGPWQQPFHIQLPVLKREEEALLLNVEEE